MLKITYGLPMPGGFIELSIDIPDETKMSEQDKEYLRSLLQIVRQRADKYFEVLEAL